MKSPSPRGHYQPDTLAAQANGSIEPHFRGVSPALYPSTTYLQSSVLPSDSRPSSDSGLPSGPDAPRRRLYARDENPTFQPPEALLAELERGAEALLFASGMAAASAVFDALDPGDHVVMPESMYFALKSRMSRAVADYRLQVTFIDQTRLEQLEHALRPGLTKIVWVETPANPLGEITDLERAVELAHRAGARVVADNTLATPILSQPLTLGVDIVMHSATKYLNGHADVVAGALVTRSSDDFWQKCRRERQGRGAILGTFEAWLLLRGMRTLPLRVKRCSETALSLARLLVQHPAVEQVYYAGLPNHPGHDIAVRQMSSGFGGVLSFRPRGGIESAARVLGRLRLFQNATSLGSVESLAEQRALVEGPESPLPKDLLRLSIGIEHTADLAEDLLQALEDAGSSAEHAGN